MSCVRKSNEEKERSDAAPPVEAVERRRFVEGVLTMNRKQS